MKDCVSYICVCVFLCVYVYVCVYVCIYVYVCMSVCLCVCVGYQTLNVLTNITSKMKTLSSFAKMDDKSAECVCVCESV